MIEYRKATQSDLDYVKQNPFEGAIKNYQYMEVPDDNTYTVIYEGQIVAVGGLQVRWKGTGLLWLILTANSKKDGIHGLRALCAIQSKVDELIKKNNVWRAEAMVRVDFPKAIKMLEFLGFKREGIMKDCFPDRSNGYLYAKVI